ncbi:MAG TPA: DUF58 domain-containing protein [Planctomycetaceae bacterium]|nr:DUF58 domain-containing protein [Planctomycetaceae bacterium]
MRWYLGSLFLLLLGLIFDLGLLVYAMYVLLAVLLVSRYLAREWIENVAARRRPCGTTAQIGDRVDVIVDVRNTGKLPIAWLLMEDSVPREALQQRPPRIRVRDSRQAIAQLKRGGTKTIRYGIEFLMRGYYQLGPLLIESGDLFGLHRRYRVLADPQFVLVYPRVVPMLGYDIASRRPIGEVRLTHRLFEDPTRIAGVRPYERGDSLNRIHWKATARTGELHSKVYEPSTIAGATFVLDFHRDRYDSRGEPFRSELAVTTVASLANAVYQLGQQVGFVTNGRDAVDRIATEGWRHEFRSREVAQAAASMTGTSDRLRPVVVPTRRGADQLMRILEALARVELTDGLPFPELILEAAGRLPRDATVVAVLPDVPPETAIALGALRRRGFAVTAVLVMYGDEDRFANAVGRLFAENVDIRRVEDEAGLAQLCAEQLVR